MLALCAVLSTLHLTGPVTPHGDDYVMVPFDVPEGTVEFTVAHDDGSATQVLDWGIWSPTGFRGWSGGITEPAVIGIDESSRGYLRGRIKAGRWTLVIGKAKMLDEMATYTVDVEFRDAPTLKHRPFADWTPVTLEMQRRWYAGDFHVHSVESGDATATVDDIVDVARARGLDFVVIADHNTSSQFPRIAAKQTEVGDVLLVRGTEVSTYSGHVSAIGTSQYVEHRTGYNGIDVRDISDDVVAQGGIFIVNHPKLMGDMCIGCAWRQVHTPWDQVDALEIQAGPTGTEGGALTARALQLWDIQLGNGADYHIAAVGGSDDHHAGREPGARIGSPTTMVLANALSESALVHAVRVGRTVVKMHGPDDPMALITATGPGDDTIGLGETIYDAAAGDPITIHAEVTGDDGSGATMVELWRDGRKVASQPWTGTPIDFERTAAVTGQIERYRLELTRGGERYTVTSHLYVDASLVAGPAAGCCSGGGAGAGGPSAALLSLLVAAQIVRRRRYHRA